MQLVKAVGWFGLAVIAVFVVAITWYGLLWFGTRAERLVFEQSYQRVEALREKVHTLRAAIDEVEFKLANTDDPEEAKELEARLRTLRVQLRAAEARLREVR